MKCEAFPKISSRMLTILPLFWGKCKGKRSVTDVRIYFLDGRPGEVDRHVLIIISRNTVINKNTRQHWICMGGNGWSQNRDIFRVSDSLNYHFSVNICSSSKTVWKAITKLSPVHLRVKERGVVGAKVPFPQNYSLETFNPLKNPI